jgi:DNA-binding CsgD family transcriptional regulator
VVAVAVRGWAVLTPREREVVALIASLGLSNSELAAWLAIGDQTVKNHITAIARRLGLRPVGAPEGRPCPAQTQRVLIVRWAWAQPDWPRLDELVLAEAERRQWPTPFTPGMRPDRE